MLLTRCLSTQVLLGAVLLVPAAAIAGTTNVPAKFVGTYLSHPHDDGSSGPSLNLSLGPDGTATVTEDPGNGTTTLFGHWAASGAQVKVTFDAVEGKPAEPAMEFAPGRGGLQAVTWNHATWGNTNPPPMKQGERVKQRLTQR